MNAIRVTSRMLACLLSSALIASAVALTRYMKCDRYTNTAPDPSNCGPWNQACPGYCKKLTYSLNCGMCVWTGNPLHTCNDVVPFTITETEYRTSGCTPSSAYNNSLYCACPEDDSSWWQYEQRTRICNCW